MVVASTETHCPTCGASYALVGRIHRCVPVGVQHSAGTGPARDPKDVARIADLEAEVASLRVENDALKSNRSNRRSNGAAKSNTVDAPTGRFDKAAYQRDYMRRKRAAARAEASA